MYGMTGNSLEGYTDADGSSQDHRHAISGYAFLMNGGAISWSSKKQELVTLSVRGHYVGIHICLLTPSQPLTSIGMQTVISSLTNVS